MTTAPSTTRYTIAGAAPDTRNLGVEALLIGAIAAIDAHSPGAEFNVLGNGFGVSDRVLDIGGTERTIRQLGARNSRRLHRSDSLANIAVSGMLRRRSNPVIRAIRSSTAFVDISGGDSFSDIYGWSRFGQICMHKLIAIRQRCPLVLLPQTIGPFESPVARRIAIHILRRASVVIARDAWSHGQLRDLLGDDFDETRHRLGPDLAFALPSATPTVDERTAEFLASDHPTVGINVSGLLYLDPDSRRRFGFADDYTSVVERVARAFLDQTDASILLVPHVVSAVGNPESDVAASDRLADRLAAPDRVHVAATPRSASEAKGLIARVDWFTGSRMHSTIAALSSGVPVASMAYSDKARGVFETAGMESHVADLRHLTADEVAAAMLASFRQRAEARVELEQVLTDVRRRSRDQVGEALEIAEQNPR
jgi:colanic acid/amylovoran biosynthesis protein WcaK/AmsJ